MRVRDVLDALERAWNAGDGAAWAACFAPDAELVDAVGRLQRGRAEIAGELAGLAAGVYRGSVIEFGELAARPVGAGLTLAHTRSLLRVPAGARAGDTHSTQTLLIGADGLVVAFQNTVRADFAAFTGGTV
ncbi:SgcJ/EcaC family oxidoreductase [Streptomyces sp. HNM0574]|uniref:SgcJ/EcaC family oxidoreductase n=1 Tax=Streptomyces sp. HNM0574 TaxID=2714954 RepID=UPI00146DC72C|nr:SgcJ/EcaC family oxidoreductase [Streptomyces sp. HNM0574]NLU69584.1 SgcJ/EcaC family oxidoreductase [Streptomyces sp. HNM0574]